MNNEYYGAASTPMDDYLAHYGVVGMKWGVRKALARRDAAGLGKQYKRAQKKLAKLEKKAEKTKTYARRAALMGAGAAAAGGLAAAGTGVVGRAMANAGEMARSSKNKTLRTIGQAVNVAGNAVNDFGRSTSLSRGARKFLNSDAVHNIGRSYVGVGNNVVKGAGQTIDRAASAASKNLNGVSNNTLVRLGAGAVGAGLAAGAARNAYKAATAKKKAERFRNEMNKAFAGTQYANSASASSSSTSNTTKKRRRNGRNA